MQMKTAVKAWYMFYLSYDASGFMLTRDNVCETNFDNLILAFIIIKKKERKEE